ncbi:MAG: DedA family protein [Kiritimatiellia bacterium]
MNITGLIERYGYFAVFIGAVLEGESVVAAAAFAAHRGFLRMAGVVTAAFLGTFLGDQLYFLLGRLNSNFVLARRPAWRPRMRMINEQLVRNQNWVIFVYRFIYGVRAITPFVIGMSPVATWRFVSICFLGSLVWTILVTGIGYSVGNISVWFFGRKIAQYEVLIFFLIIFAGFCIWLYRRHRHRRRAPAAHFLSECNPDSKA